MILNKLLSRQITKYLGGVENIPPGFSDFLSAISESYDHYERDHKLLERTIDLNSSEMIALNEELRAETRKLTSANFELKTLFENIEEVVFSVDMKEYKLIQISNACEKIYGYTPEEFFLNSTLWQDVIHPDDMHINAKQIVELVRGNKVTNQYRIIHRDGSERWIENKIIPTMDGMGHLVRIDGITNDITEQKLLSIERDKITSDLLQRNRDLEQFAYIISHNLRLPLSNIMGLVNLVQNHDGLSKTDYEHCLQGLLSSSNKLDGVLKDLNHILQVRRGVNEEKKVPVMFSELVSDIQSSIEDLLVKENVKIETDFSAVDQIMSLKSYLYSIFFNLISNSIKYRNGRNPHIKISSCNIGGKIRLVFKDNGLGIDLTNQGNKIFGLYNRFHSNTEGKGIGLFMTKTQVEILGGNIHVESAVNVGTEFSIELQAA